MEHLLAASPPRLLKQWPVQHQLGCSFSRCQVYGWIYRTVFISDIALKADWQMAVLYIYCPCLQWEIRMVFQSLWSKMDCIAYFCLWFHLRISGCLCDFLNLCPKYSAMPHPLWEIPSEDITRTVTGMNCRQRGWFLPLPLLPRPISLQVAGRSGGNWYKPTSSMSIT